MAKILCSISGVEFTCEHFPITLHSREYHHPIFTVPQKRLLSYLGKWSAGELTPTDSYLLFLALLRSSGNVNFRIAAARCDLTNSIVANNMEVLAHTVCKLNAVTNPHVVFPTFVISPETRFLLNVHHWIEAWETAWKEFQDGYRQVRISAKLVRREEALERLIKNSHKSISSYAHHLAEWAALAGSFPECPAGADRSGSLSDYWKEIIEKISQEHGIFSVPLSDLQELLTHCEDNIPAGTIFSNKLFTLLRESIKKQGDFLGLGEVDTRETTFSILSSTDDIESANMAALIQAAPPAEPKRESYPNTISYLKAKLRWEMATRSTEFRPKGKRGNDGLD